MEIGNGEPHGECDEYEYCTGHFYKDGRAVKMGSEYNDSFAEENGCGWEEVLEHYIPDYPKDVPGKYYHGDFDT